MLATAVQILTATPITSENPSRHLHDKTPPRPGNSNHQRSASSGSDNSIQSCIAHDIPAPTQPKTTIPALTQPSQLLTITDSARLSNPRPKSLTQPQPANV
ncbi:hypothetical protein HNY73_009625 [Argiope bruennichi]|uniref:Uncharacterized protein n=1 Tax=Argiope bruennichi TaxID=94029 RepID=A0A8T0FFM9_ARGBR|nr:hypothetical protein HNY73_009625 [Argiope bruennichi]